MIYHVFANKSNIGDWLSAIGIQKLLAPLPVVELLCDEPFVRETLTQLREASSRDVIVIGGGGLFMDYFEPFWNGLLERKSKAWICIWGVGFCDLKQIPSRPPLERIREIVATSDFCFVRDLLTAGLIADPLIPPPGGCPSFAAIDPPQDSGLGVLHVDNYTTAGAEVYEAMDAIARNFAEARSCPFLRTNNRITGGSQSELEKTLDKYRQADVVVSSALHGCILGVAMRRKVVAVSGDWKIESFMQQVGLGDWVCSQEDVNRISDLFVKLSEQRIDDDAIKENMIRNKIVAGVVSKLAARDKAATS